MLIYSGTKAQFDADVQNDTLARKVQNEFFKHGIFNDNDREFRAWENSLKEMQVVLDDARFPSDLQVAVEYQIPQTSKRVDFIIAGANENDEDNVVIVELKQWEDAHKTSSDGIVSTYVAGMVRAVAHPSYQAYSYAKTIENFNATVQDENIVLHPCAYLHNYKKSALDELTAPIYGEIIDLAPLFIKHQEKELRDFISHFVCKSSKADLLFKIDNGKIRPSKALQDALVSMINGNQEFIMIDEQKVVYEAVKSLIKKANETDQKYTIIVEGGPGTGKSVVAIQLLCDLITEQGMLVNYVTKNAAPRNVYFEMLKQGKAKMTYMKTLFKGSGSYVGCKPNFFDCLIVDEAHRLNAKSGMFQNLGENQIKEIIEASKVSVFFIDETQRVTSKDIGTVDEIKKWANKIGTKLYCGERYNLTSQFRCNGSDGYINFINDLLQIKETANKELDGDYEFKVFDDASDMREALRQKNLINNKSRMLAGYCYEWVTKNSNDLSLYDIELPNFKARWNFNTTQTWAIDKESFDQVGCIHTSQGLEFDYVGVIIGRDLKYNDGQVVTDPTSRAKTDQSLKGLKSDPEFVAKADKIIRNTYKVLLTRGQKGCYVYCEDEALAAYIKQRIGQSQ